MKLKFDMRKNLEYVIDSQLKWIYLPMYYWRIANRCRWPEELADHQFSTIRRIYGLFYNESVTDIRLSPQAHLELATCYFIHELIKLTKLMPWIKMKWKCNWKPFKTQLNHKKSLKLLNWMGDRYFIECSTMHASEKTELWNAYVQYFKLLFLNQFLVSMLP